jgi:hypothetical protein
MCQSDIRYSDSPIAERNISPIVHFSKAQYGRYKDTIAKIGTSGSDSARTLGTAGNPVTVGQPVTARSKQQQRLQLYQRDQHHETIMNRKDANNSRNGNNIDASNISDASNKQQQR